MLAKELGMKDRNIIIPELGMQVEINKNNVFKPCQMVPAGDVLIDGSGLGEKDSNVIRERLLLSQDGVCAVLVCVDKNSKQMVGLPEIVAKGFVYQSEANDIISASRELIAQKLAELDIKEMDSQELKSNIRKISQAVFFKQTKRKPVVISLVKEV